jgi:hypothetical protein
MSQQQLWKFVTALLPSWRVTRRKVLILGAQGLLRRRRLTLCGIARGLESQARIIHRVKRIWRFIDNAAVLPHEVVAALVREAFALRSEAWVPIILDETGLEDRAMLLGAATSYRGRALPLALYAYNSRVIKRSLWVLREGLISLILQSLPEQQRPRLLLIADRGYAASHFFRRLLKARVAFVIRVPRRVLLYMAHQTHRLEYLAGDLKPGDSIFLQDVFYGPAKAKLNLLLWWESDQQEPWLLATTLPSAHEARLQYKLRMHIEELFKDLKGTFALEACRCQTFDRITRMGLFLLVSLWALALLVRYPANWTRFITARGKLSFLTLALEWLYTPPWLRRQLRQEVESG